MRGGCEEDARRMRGGCEEDAEMQGGCEEDAEMRGGCEEDAGMWGWGWKWHSLGETGMTGMSRSQSPHFTSSWLLTSVFHPQNHSCVSILRQFFRKYC